MSIAKKMIVLGIGPVVVVVVIILGISLYKDASTLKKVEALQDHADTVKTNITTSLEELMEREISAISRSVYDLCKAQNEVVQLQVQYDLNVAREVFHNTGHMSLSQETVSWKSVNQITKEAGQIELPKMLVGDIWLGQNRELDQPSPIVDKVKELVGGTCTIFQRMNQKGDMLRVCTNVEKLDGTRAIGTYIPHTSPVVQAVLQGETFYGRAYVVNAWYITAYEPIVDSHDQVQGVLYVGVKQENVTSLRKAIMSTKVGKTGYVYIIGGSGGHKGNYIISKDGKRDGENIWDAKDADGRYFIREIVNKAIGLKEGETATITYPWKNKGEVTARGKIASLAYFKQWDWVIGSGAYKDDFTEVTKKADKIAENLLAMSTEVEEETTFFSWVSIGISIALVVVMGVVIFFVSGNIVRAIKEVLSFAEKVSQGDFSHRLNIKNNDETGKLAKAFNAFCDNLGSMLGEVKQNAANLVKYGNNLTSISSTLASNSTQVNTQATNVASTTEEMSTNISTVASTAEEMSTNISEVSSTSDQLAQNMNSAASAVEEVSTSMNDIRTTSQEGTQVASDAKSKAEIATSTMSNLGEAANEIGEVTDVIKRIAEQTNLLALNATIEAASAGEAGKGFAVVANEIKELANQSAKAAEDIAHRIEGMQKNTGQAVDVIGEVAGVVDKISSSVEGITNSVTEQTQVMNEMAANVAETNDGVINITKAMKELSTGATDMSKNIGEAAKGANDVAANIHGVSEASEETNTAAQNLDKTAKELSQAAVHLEELVGIFQLS